MKRIASVFTALIIVAIICLGVVYAKWLMPISADVGFEYTPQQTSTLTVTFDTNSVEEGYSSLSLPKVTLSQEEVASYVLPKEQFEVYDTDPSKKYYFGGWYTQSQGGVKVEEGDLASVAEGMSEITLYARWNNKASLLVTLQDLNASYDISFCLTSDDMQYLVSTSSTQTLTKTYYISPESLWSVTVEARNKSVTIDNSVSPISDGGRYSYSALINLRGTVNLPSQFSVV